MFSARGAGMALIAAVCLSHSIAHGQMLMPADIPTDVPPDLKRLIEATYSEDFGERKLAAQKIGEMGAPAAPAVPFLMRLLGDRDPNAEAFVEDNFARDALVAIGEPAIEPCIAAANDRNSGVQRMAMNTLTKFTSPRADQALVELLSVADRQTRGFAVAEFETFVDTRSLEPLLNDLNSGRDLWDTFLDNDRRVSIIKALGRQRDRRALPPLRAILRNPKEDEWRRAAAARALGRISERSDYPLLIDILRDPTESTHVRAGAARGLGVYRPAIMIAESDSVEAVRDDARLIALMDKILRSEDEMLELQVAAAEALGDLGNPKAVKRLLPVVHSASDRALRFWAAISVVKLTDGAIDDGRIVAALHSYDGVSEGPIDDRIAKHDAMIRIAHNGSWTSEIGWLGFMVWLAPCFVLIVIGLLWRMRTQRPGRGRPKATDSGAVEK